MTKEQKRKEYQKSYQVAYRATSQFKAYRASPGYKAKRKAREATPEQRAKRRVKQRARRNTVGVGTERRPLAERFWEKVDKNGPLPSTIAVEHYPEIAGTRCWPWTGCVDPKGYGNTWAGKGLTNRAHRVAFFLEYGFWPTPCGLHKCDNPPCCNPEHLFEGTDKDNAVDMVSKGRHKTVSPKGEDHGMAKLKPADVMEIKALRTAGRPAKELAKEYGVCQGYIYTIAAGKSWSHLSA